MVAAGIKGRPTRAGNPTYPRMLLPERYSDEGVPRARSVGSARGHQDLVSRKAFGRRCATLGALLFPTSSGEPCSILGVTATIEAAAVQFGLPRRSPEGLTLWTEHLLRVGGAQSLAIAGLETWTIQLVGWWVTEAVLGYVKLASLAMSRTWAARASAGPALGAQLGTVVSRSTQPHDSEVLGVRACWGASKSELQR